MKKIIAMAVLLCTISCSGTTFIMPHVVVRPDGTIELDFTMTVTSTPTGTSTTTVQKE